MLILSAGSAGASGVIPNIVVTRDMMPPDLPSAPKARMTALLDLQVAQMRGQLAGFAEVSRQLVADDARLTAELKVDWDSAQALLTQMLTFMDRGEQGLLIATATAGRGEFAKMEPTFRDMLQSFRFVR